MKCSPQEKKRFRSIGHGLKPVVTVASNGLSEGVLAELERALEDHELIKVKLVIEDRDDRKSIAGEICAQLHAELIQTIGKIILLYRAAKKPKLATSNIRRYQTP